MQLRTPRDVGSMIRARRNSFGWDQQTLADRAGVSRLWVSEIERGKPGAQLDLVLRTLGALDVTIRADDETDAATAARGPGKSQSAMLIAGLLGDVPS